MTVIGVLLILVAVALLLIGLLAGADTSTTLSLGGVDISMSAMGIFLMGAATVLIFVSGLEMLRSGLRRSLRHRRELKEARALVADQERRERETGAEPSAAGATGSVTGAPTTAAPSTSETATSETGATRTTPTQGDTTSTGTADTTRATPDSTDDSGRHAR